MCLELCQGNKCTPRGSGRLSLNGLVTNRAQWASSGDLGRAAVPAVPRLVRLLRH